MHHTRQTPTSLNKSTGISRDTIGKIRDGKRFPELDTLERLAEALGTTAGALIDGTLPKAVSRPSNAAADSVLVQQVADLRVQASEIRPLIKTSRLTIDALLVMLDELPLQSKTRATALRLLESARGEEA